MAKSVNKVILLGNVGKDPEIRSTPSGVMVANLTLATSDRQKASLRRSPGMGMPLRSSLRISAITSCASGSSAMARNTPAVARLNSSARVLSLLVPLMPVLAYANFRVVKPPVGMSSLKQRW